MNVLKAPQQTCLLLHQPVPGSPCPCHLSPPVPRRSLGAAPRLRPSPRHSPAAPPLNYSLLHEWQAFPIDFV